MSAAVDADLARHYRELDDAERFDRAVEARAEDAYSDPKAMLEAASWFAECPRTAADKATSRLFGEVLVYATQWARAFHEAPEAGMLEGIAAKLVIAARNLDMSDALQDVMTRNAHEWVLAKERTARDDDQRID